MSSDDWRITRTDDYINQIHILPEAEQEKIGDKVSELFQRPHPSRPEQTEERLIFHFPGVEPSRAVYDDIDYELTYEIKALSRELRLLSVRRLDHSVHRQRE
jgi:hypothetical protein